MHDWTFKAASVDWQASTARLEFSSDRTLKVIRAIGLSNMRLQRKVPLGLNVAVDQSEGPTSVEGGEYNLVIKMQSGDKIELVARQFEMPSA